MGVGYWMLCNDCKAWADVGYGSQQTWEFDEPGPYADRAKNVAVRRFKERHRGHHVSALNLDYARQKGRDLVSETGPWGDDELLIADFDTWTNDLPSRDDANG